MTPASPPGDKSGPCSPFRFPVEGHLLRYTRRAGTAKEAKKGGTHSGTAVGCRAVGIAPEFSNSAIDIDNPANPARGTKHDAP